MSVEIETAASGPYTASGADQTFNVTFFMASASEIAVYVDEVLLSPASYVVLRLDSGTGTVRPVPPLAAGKVVRIESAPHFRQETVFAKYGGFDPSQVNPPLDRAAARDIWLKENKVAQPSLASRVGKLLGFSLAGAAVAMAWYDVAAAVTPYLPTTFKGDKGDVGFTVPRWDQFETLNIPAGNPILVIADTMGTAGGTGAFHVKLDADQTEIPSKAAYVITQAVARGQTLANAQADFRAAQKMWRRKSANNLWYVECEPDFNARQAGIVGDGDINSSNVFSGTQVGYAAQTYIDYCLYLKGSEPYFPDTAYRLEKGLNYGWGSDFVGGGLRGGGVQYAGSTALGGTAFLKEDERRPTISVHGARKLVFRDFTVDGTYTKHLIDNALALRANTAGPLDDLLEQSWRAAFLPTTQNGRYNPHCHIAIDPRSGARASQVPVAHANTTAYATRASVFVNGNVYIADVGGTSGTGTSPTGTGAAIADGTVVWSYVGAYNAGAAWQHLTYDDVDTTGHRWVAGTSQDNWNSYSSDISFENMMLLGAVVNFVNGPSANALQKDFMRFFRVQSIYSRDHFSDNPHQSRNVILDGCDFAIGHTFITNRKHGNQTGAGQYLVQGCSFGAGVNIHDLQLSYGGSSTFINCYSEAQARLGVLVPGGSGDTGVHYINCRWNFVSHISRGRCGNILRQSTGGFVTDATSRDILFLGGILSFDGALGMFVEGQRYDGTLVYDYQTATLTLAAGHPLKWAINATAGGLFLPGLMYSARDQRIRFPLHNLDTGAPTFAAAETVRGYNQGSRQFTIPFPVRSVRAASSGADEEIVVPWGAPLTTSKAGVTVTQGAAGNEMNVVLASASQSSTADLQGFAAGAAFMFIDTTTNTVTCGYVRSFVDGTDTAILVALDNYKTVAGVTSWLVNPVTAATGTFYFRRSGVYTPANPVFFDCTDASTAITNVGNSARVGTALTTDMSNSDYVVTSSGLNALFGTTHTATITGITNGSPGSASFDTAVAAGMGGTRRRLAFLRRPMPASV